MTINGKKCKMWPGPVDKDGYGMVKMNGTQTRAHRVALELHLKRRLKKGEVAMHLCHTPGCYEAKHLQAGTVADNNRMTRQRSASLANKHLPGWAKLY